MNWYFCWALSSVKVYLFFSLFLNFVCKTVPLTSGVTLTTCNHQGPEPTEPCGKRAAASQRLMYVLASPLSPPSSCTFYQPFLLKLYYIANAYLYILFAFSVTAPEVFPSHCIHVCQLNFSPDGLASCFQVHHRSFPTSTCNCSPVSFLGSSITPKGFSV